VSRFGYTVRGFGAMIADRVRTEAYEAALARTVGPTSVVLDVGTGTGYMALLACRLGARHVYAVEPNDAINLGRAAARASGMGDRITFIQGFSTRIELPERADVIVSDLRGVLPLAAPHLPSAIDLRSRLLAEGGVMIPLSDTIWVAPVEAEEQHRRITAPWTEHAAGLDLTASLRAALNDWEKTRFAPEQLLAQPQVLATLDYRTLTSSSVDATLSWTVERESSGHGLAVWFDARLLDGIGFSTAPHAPLTIYSQGYFPWLRPVALRPGDRVSARMTAHLVSNEYVWGWETRVEGRDGSMEHFKQSTMLARMLSPELLRLHAHDHRPVLADEGRVARLVLERMDGSVTVGEIATELQLRFPGRFAGWKEALSYVGELSEAYSS
jgi:type I protein arginine methyltransferase